jgi:hypothetical protein
MIAVSGVFSFCSRQSPHLAENLLSKRYAHAFDKRSDWMTPQLVIRRGEEYVARGIGSRRNRPFVALFLVKSAS